MDDDFALSDSRRKIDAAVRAAHERADRRRDAAYDRAAKIKRDADLRWHAERAAASKMLACWEEGMTVRDVKADLKLYQPTN